MSDSLQDFYQYFAKVFPRAALDAKVNSRLRAELISPFTLQLPVQILADVENFVEKVYRIKEDPSYLSEVDENIANHPDTPSILSCFDFHYSPDMGLKLIEINTNASLYLTSWILYQSKKIHCKDENLDSLYSSLQKTFSLKGDESIAIMDREPKKEGLYFEFLIFKEWLESRGHSIKIINAVDFDSQQHPLVYNRFTDFHFSESDSQNIQLAYLQNKSLFSPNPREYRLIADKHRLSLLRKHLQQKEPGYEKMIPQDKLFIDFADKEELWQKRKKYFFKPTQSFGSKGVYSGKGISRKAFEAIYQENFMAQELCPPEKREFQYGEDSLQMKYDLRFYTYAGKVQHYVTRLYQGQATNMKTTHGGLAPIRFI